MKEWMATVDLYGKGLNEKRSLAWLLMLPKII